MSNPSYPNDLEGVVDIGDRHFVLRSTDRWLWWHDCSAPHPSWGWFGPASTGASGHVVVSEEPLTVQGSLLCSVCGDHGFIEAGRWRSA